MKAGMRRYISVLAAIILYYIVHEGAHFIFAMAYGVFKELRLIGLGVQVVLTEPSFSTDLQFAVFNIAGSVATLSVAYVLVSLSKKICVSTNKLFKAVCYYLTLCFLLNDPVYLSILCGFFGGGDMNGIIMFGISEWAARLIFLIIGFFNVWLFSKYVYPVYKKSFAS